MAERLQSSVVMTAAAHCKSDPGIYKVDTVPPPAGEESAYDAVTRVGPMAKAAIQELFAEAESKGTLTTTTAPPQSGIRVAKAPAIPAPAALPVLYDDYEDEADADDSVFEPTGVANMPAAAPLRAAAPLAAEHVAAKIAPSIADAAPMSLMPEPTVPVLFPTEMPTMYAQADKQPPIPLLVAAVLVSLVLLAAATNAVVGVLTG